MKKITYSFFFTLLLLTVGNSIAWGVTITSTLSGGNWNTPSTWVGSTVPSAGDNIIIDGNVTIDITPLNLGTLTINSGRTLTFGATVRTLSVTDFDGAGALDMSGAAHTFNVGGTSTFTGTLTTDTNASTISYNAALSHIIFPSPNYRNLIIGSGSGGSKTIQASTTINGNLTINDPLQLLNATTTLTVNGNCTNNSTFAPTVVPVIFNGTNWTNNGTFIAGTSTITFSGTGVQNIGGISTTTFNNLTINGTISTILDLNASVTVAGTTEIINGTLREAGGALLTHTFGVLNVRTNGSFTKTGGSSSDFRFAGNILNQGVFALTSGSPKWKLGSGGTSITVQNQHPTNVMVFSGLGSGTGTIEGDVTVLDFAGGANVRMFGNYAISIITGKTLTNQLGDAMTDPTGAGRKLIITTGNGTPDTTGAAGNLVNGANAILEYGIGSNTTFPTHIFNCSASGNLVIYNSDYILPGNYHHIQIIPSLNNTLINNITLNGNLTINTGATLTTNNFNIDIKGDWTNNGTGVFNAGTTTGTVTFNGTAIQTIGGNSSTIFNNITLSNTTNAVSVAGGTNFTVTGNWNNTGFFNPGVGTSNVIAFISGASKTISGTGTSFNNLQINGGSQVTLTSNIFIAKDLLNNGIFNGAGFQVGFIVNSSNQNIQGTGTTTFGNLFINKTGTPQTVTLSQSITVTGTLQLTSGRIVLGANDLTLTNGTPFSQLSPSSFLPTSTSYIETNGTGKLIRNNLVGGTDYAFPVGDATAIRWIETRLSSNGTAGCNFKAGPILPTPPTGSTDVAAGTWNISATSTVSVGFKASGSVLTSSKIHIDNSGWNILGTTLLSPGYASAFTATAPTAGANFTIFTPNNDYYSLTNTNWNDNTTGKWSNDGTTNCNCSPAGVANANVRIRHIVQVQNPTDIGTINTVDVQGGGVLQFNAINTNQITTIKSSIGAGKLVFNTTNLPDIANDANNTFANTAGTTLEFSGTLTNIPNGFGASPIYQNLIISGTNAKTLTGDIIVNGDLTINAGATLTAGSNNINIKGNWVSNGIFTAGTGTITFNGTNAQNLIGTSTFNNLTANNTAGIFVSNNITIQNSLSLINGIVTIGANDIIYSGTDANLIVGAGWVATNGASSGFFIRTQGGSFPVGSPALKYFATITPTPVTTIKVRFTSPVLPSPSGTDINSGMWVINCPNTYNLSLSSISASTSTKIYTSDGASAWNIVAGSGGGAGTYAATGVIGNAADQYFTTFSGSVVTAVVPIQDLPVFSGSSLSLSWTADPANVSYSLERSTNSIINFNVIAPTLVNANYTDTNLQRGNTYYYRVKGYDGTNYSGYSNIKGFLLSADTEITITGLDGTTQQNIKVYPNPSNSGVFSIEGLERLKNVEIQVLSANGRLIKVISEGNTIALENEPAGLYLLVLRDKNTIWTKKILKN